MPTLRAPSARRAAKRAADAILAGAAIADADAATLGTVTAPADAAPLADAAPSAPLAAVTAGPDATPDATPDAIPADAAPTVAPGVTAAAEREADLARTRALAYALVASLGYGGPSCPIKPIATLAKTARDLHPRGGRVDKRPASAAAAAILASGQRIPTSPDAAPVTFPRAFTLATGERVGIENGGGGQRILDLPGATYAHGAGEPDGIGTFTLTAAAGRAIVSLLGSAIPADARA